MPNYSVLIPIFFLILASLAITYATNPTGAWHLVNQIYAKIGASYHAITEWLDFSSTSKLKVKKELEAENITSKKICDNDICIYFKNPYYIWIVNRSNPSQHLGIAVNNLWLKGTYVRGGNPVKVEGNLTVEGFVNASEICLGKNCYRHLQSLASTKIPIFGNTTILWLGNITTLGDIKALIGLDNIFRYNASTDMWESGNDVKVYPGDYLRIFSIESKYVELPAIIVPGNVNPFTGKYKMQSYNVYTEFLHAKDVIVYPLEIIKMFDKNHDDYIGFIEMLDMIWCWKSPGYCPVENVETVSEDVITIALYLWKEGKPISSVKPQDFGVYMWRNLFISNNDTLYSAVFSGGKGVKVDKLIADEICLGGSCKTSWPAAASPSLPGSVSLYLKNNDTFVKPIYLTYLGESITLSELKQQIESGEGTAYIHDIAKWDVNSNTWIFAWEEPNTSVKSGDLIAVLMGPGYRIADLPAIGGIVGFGQILADSIKVNKLCLGESCREVFYGSELVYYFSSGWNLVSFPFLKNDGSQYTVDELLNEINSSGCDVFYPALYWFNPSAGWYEMYSGDDLVDPTKSYWILMDENENCRYKPQNVQYLKAAIITLQPGWNMVALPICFYGMDSSRIIKALGLTENDKLAVAKVGTEQGDPIDFIHYYIAPGDYFILDFGEGIWIYNSGSTRTITLTCE